MTVAPLLLQGVVVIAFVAHFVSGGQVIHSPVTICPCLCRFSMSLHSATDIAWAIMEAQRHESNGSHALSVTGIDEDARVTLEVMSVTIDAMQRHAT